MLARIWCQAPGQGSDYTARDGIFHKSVVNSSTQSGKHKSMALFIVMLKVYVEFAVQQPKVQQSSLLALLHLWRGEAS